VLIGITNSSRNDAAKLYDNGNEQEKLEKMVLSVISYFSHDDGTALVNLDHS